MTREVWIRIGASILLGFLVFVVITKLWLWRPIEHPLGVVGQRVQDLEDAVKLLGEMGMDLRRLDPIPWSQRCKGWVQSVRDLQAKADAIIKVMAADHNGSGLISYLSMWYFGKQATKELIKRAADLIEEGKELLKQAQARPRRAPAPAPARAVPVLLPNHFKSKALSGMDSYKQGTSKATGRFPKEDDMELKKATNLVDEEKERLQELNEAQAKPQAVRRVPPPHQDPQIQLYTIANPWDKVRDFIQKNDNNSTHQSRLLAIVGKPGVGKTSLLELVRDSPEVRALSFDHVLFVRAGRGATVVTMQKAIAVSLGLLPLMHDDDDDDDDQTYLNLRARIIYKHLRGKSFLLLIDDLCGYLDLKCVGIPMPRTWYKDVRCKVVFTTRSYDVCQKMDCTGDNAVHLGTLTEADAWDLFISKVGKEITTGYFQSLARQLVHECGGLPLALCTIGRAMSTKKHPWKSAIYLLRRLNLRTIVIMRNYLEFSEYHDSTKTEENDLKKLRETTYDFVGTSDDLMKAVLALVVIITPVSKDRIVSYIRLKEMDRPSLHGMGSYQMKVLGFVEDETPSLLGIWGVPGVGRTTLLRFVRDYAHEFFPYDAFFVRAGSGCTVRRLQHALCVSIGLAPPPLHMIDVSLKEHIFSSLKHTPFLLLVDDVSERLDLEELGLPIPLGHNQKVIFTTTNGAICTEMGCTEDTSIHMKCLGQEDAWNLFNDKVGHEIINDHPHIKRLAKQMADECLGLPSVLCTLGRAMSTKRDVKEWRYAYDLLLRMKSPQVDRIRETNDDRYRHLYHLQDTLLKHSFF